MKNSAISWWFLDAASFYGVFKVKTKQAMDEIVHTYTLCDVMEAHMVVILHLPILFLPSSTRSNNFKLKSKQENGYELSLDSTRTQPGFNWD